MTGTGGKAARYLLTGGSAAFVDTGVFAAMLAAGMTILPASILSFLVATLVNYGLSARFVFGTAHSIGGYLRFLGAAMIGFAINVGLTTWLADVLPRHVPADIAAVLPRLAIVAKVIDIAVAFFVNFAINLRVFRARVPVHPAD